MWGKKIGGEKVFFEKMKYSRRGGGLENIMKVKP